MCNGYFLQGKICYRTGKVMARRHGKSEIGWLAHWQFVNLAKDTIPIKIIISSLREERCPLSIFPLGTFLYSLQNPSPVLLFIFPTSSPS